MNFMPGSHLGSYESLSLLGAGGMGEVYRAHDSKLNRNVAIKVLPELFANDPERLARFTREAQTLAALNHPNIAAIYGIEEFSGGRALIMELVEGEDLSVIIERGPIAIGEALPIARQIAEALEAAHEQGIVHRDLKPANIKVRPDGTVKVLDFGLAKGMDPAGSSSPDAMNSPTLTGLATQMGTLMGTAAYMSPEQARGKSVDKRSDIWAFGVVLYEMLTGLRLFSGETTSDTLASVLKTDPDWARLPAGAPPSILHLLHRCLDRNPKCRLQAIGEARVSLEQRTLADPGSVSGGPGPAAIARATSRERVAWAIATLAFIIAVALAVRILLHQAGSTPSGPLHFSLSLGSSEVTPTGIAISPDGLRVAFDGREPGATRGAIFVRSLHEAAAKPLSGAEGATAPPVFSPDGRWIAYISDYHALKKVPIEGGAPTTLFEGNLRYAQPAWLDNGKILLTRFDPDKPGVIYEIPEEGGQMVPVAGKPEQATQTVVRPQPLPGGRLVLLEVAGARPALAVQSLETGERRILAQDARFARSVGQSIVWIESGRLVGARFDPARLAFSSAPATIPTDGLDGGSAPTGLDASLSGSLVFRHNTIPDPRLVWIDRNGAKTRATTREGICNDPRLSPDGIHVTADGISGNKDDADVWTFDLRRGTSSPFTFGAGENETALWSPDGTWIAWAAERAGEGRSLFRRHSDGSGAEEKLWSSDGRHFHADAWTSDGKSILVCVDDPQKGWDVYQITLGPKPSAKPLLSNPCNETSPRVSPDGRWIVYVSDESGRNEIYVQAFPDLGHKVQISVAGGTEPIWHPRGDEIIYRSTTSRDFMSVAVMAGGTLQLSTPRVLVSDANTARGTTDHTAFDVAPDGRFLAAEEPPADARAELHIILGWAQAAGLLR